MTVNLTPPLLTDGSVRDALGLRLPRAQFTPETLNERNPALVQAVHRDFLAAGAMLHRTNTQQANREVMAPLGLEERCEAMNNSGSALLAEVLGAEGVRMGSIGMIGADPTGVRPPPPLRERAYSEQIVYLSDTEVSFFLLEHVTDVEEALLVLRLAQHASDAPVLAQLQFGPDGRTADGQSATAAAVRLRDAGAEALGLCCTPPPQQADGILDALLATGLPVSYLPGFSHGKRSPGSSPGGGRANGGATGGMPWSPDPAAFAAAVSPWVARGVAIVGGCCGVMPEHIAALAQALGMGPAQG